MRAGLATATIAVTPPVHLAGFGARTEPADRVHDDLEARALYLDDGQAVCLIVCDLLAMTPDVSRPIREAVAAELGVAIGSVLVACTHTHSGPSAITGSQTVGWPVPAGLAASLEEACLGAARAARACAVPATLAFASVPLPGGFAYNRRGGLFPDPSFVLLDVQTEEGRLGTLVNLPVHPVLLGPRWLAVATDWVGPLRTELERLAGGTAVELAGALGDINPTPPSGRPTEDYEPWATEREVCDYGRALARVIADGLEEAEPVGDGIEVLRDETIEAPVGGTALAAAHGAPTMSVELVEWRIGDLRVVSVPGEGFWSLGRAIAASRDSPILLAGLAPAWHGYLPYPFTQGYEEDVSYGRAFVETVCEALL